MISRYFIERPILACVIAAFILIAGLAGMRALPISSYPDVLPPQVFVTAVYPGANAETISETVAAPLEEEINGVENMLYMSSVNAGTGTMSITVSFAVGSDPDLAAINVNNRVQAALPRLPEDVRRQGVIVRKSSANLLLIVSFHAPNGGADVMEMNNYVLLNVVDELRRIRGVGSVELWGTKEHSMRVWLRPDQLSQLGLSPSDIAAAIREQNSEFAAGRIGAEPIEQAVDFTYTVSAQGRLSTVDEFEQIIVRSNEDGTIVRLRDVARVELGAQSYDFDAIVDGHESVPLGIFLQPGANALEVTEGINRRLQELSPGFPEGVEYSIPYDTTRFVEVSIREVVKTLLEAMVLVFIVVLVFLQNWRATLIPMLAVPVSLVGAFAVMPFLGFSINMLTLFAMVLAIGIVVDDAIVVLENVERIMHSEKVSARVATEKAMDEVTRPVIAIVLVLTAVFLPVVFLGGLVGEMYRQFAVTISVAVAISGFVALTLTPALCALLLKPEHKVRFGVLERFNDWFGRMTEHYVGGVRFMMRRVVVAVSLFGVMLLVTAGLFRDLPSSLAPTEDQGYIFAVAVLQDAASLHRTRTAVEAIAHDLQQHPSVSNVIAFSGLDPLTFSARTNVGAIWLTLKDWDQRPTPDLSPAAAVGAAFAAGAKLRDALVLAFEPPPIEGLSATGGFEGYVQVRGGGSIKALEGVTQKLIEAAGKRPELAGVTTTFSASVPQMRIDLNRDKAKQLGVPITAVFESLQSTFGALYVNDFSQSGRSFQVQLQSEPHYRAYPDDIRDVFVRAAGGELVPLTAVASIREVLGPELVERFNAFPAAKIYGGAAPGYSSGDALEVMEALVKEVLPNGYTFEWTGAAYQEKTSGNAAIGAFLLGVLMVFLILAAQYERWTLPIAVILAVPFAVFGALVAVWGRGLQNDIYFQIGVITLIGLAAKNAILIVEFASMKHAAGMSVAEAAVQAARLRFRPIIMTSLALIFGVLPLALSTGAGAASRHSLGTSVIGGMIAATFIATFFVPLFFRWVAGRRNESDVAHATSEA